MPQKTTFLITGGFWPVVLRLCGCVLLLLATIRSGQGQSLEEAQKQYYGGQYEEVIQSARKALETSRFRTEWRVLLVQTLLTVGQYEAAHTNAQAGLNNYTANIGLLLLAREAALYRNDLTGASNRLSEIAQFIERRRAPSQSPQELVELGQALLLLGVEPRLVLENCFQRAQKSDSPPREAFLASGRLALEKHEFKLAAETFRAALKQFPQDPDMDLGLAQAFENGDTEQKLESISDALDKNPRHIPSLLLLADHLIDAEQYGEAEKQLALVLKVNPEQPEALAYRAVLAHLRNDADAEKILREAALKNWSTNPRVDYVMGHKLSQKYRFEEGAAAQRRALAFDPESVEARRQLAVDLLRLGQNEEGWALATAVHKQDGYDVTAFNLANLHDLMVTFHTITNADFILRMSPHEARLYGDRVMSLLMRAKETLSRKYAIELARPTVVEIFPEQKDFAVRTFGMPGNPGYLGVCFGSVITANSPNSQAPNPANWEAVLWHEFCHVITLNATRNRMPRWLSEGISVYEERQADPTWGEQMNLTYRERILRGNMTPLGKLSSAFLTAKNGQDLQFAYYQSSLVIEFFVERFGSETLKKILTDLHDGQEINQSIAKHTMALAEAEKQFVEFARAKAEKVASGLDLGKPPTGMTAQARAVWEELHPDNYFVRMNRVRELLRAKKWKEAGPLLESIAQAYHGEGRAENPLWLLAVTQRNLNETNAELATLENLARQESGFVDLYARLLELFQERKDWPAVTKYAERLLAINPLISLPWRALAESSLALGKNDPAIQAYGRLLLLDPPDPAEVHFQLARLLHTREGATSEARRHVLQALEEAPRFRQAQRLLLEMEGKKPDTKADTKGDQ